MIAFKSLHLARHASIRDRLRPEPKSTPAIGLAMGEFIARRYMMFRMIVISAVSLAFGAAAPAIAQILTDDQYTSMPPPAGYDDVTPDDGYVDIPGTNHRDSDSANASTSNAGTAGSTSAGNSGAGTSGRGGTSARR
jgi:hypothetical protein